VPLAGPATTVGAAGREGRKQNLPANRQREVDRASTMIRAGMIQHHLRF
jgi:hypothetical protein